MPIERRNADLNYDSAEKADPILIRLTASSDR